MSVRLNPLRSHEVPAAGAYDPTLWRTLAAVRVCCRSADWHSTSRWRPPEVGPHRRCHRSRPVGASGQDRVGSRRAAGAGHALSEQAAEQDPAEAASDGRRVGRLAAWGAIGVEAESLGRRYAEIIRTRRRRHGAAFEESAYTSAYTEFRCCSTLATAIAKTRKTDGGQGRN